MSTDEQRYRDLKPLGAGGMGQVTLAEDSLLGRQVALKRLRSEHSISAISRLKREALVGASVNHPNLVSIFDVFTEADGGVVIVMEYVPGHTLAEAIAGSGGLPPHETIRILEGVGAGLDAIHARGIVHRDVKPANVLLGDGGVVKLADLGVAAVPDGTQITSAGTVLGSWRYMAPEQLEGERSTPALDIYALAAVAYETLSGHAARREQNPMALAHAIATQAPPDIRRDWAGAPPATAAVLSRGMARDTAERPASAGRLVEELAATLQPVRPQAPAAEPVAAAAVPVAAAAAAAPARPRPASAPERPRQMTFSGPPPSSGGRGLWLALLLGLAALAVVAIVIASSSGSSTPASHRTIAAATPAHHHTKSAATHSASSSSATAAVKPATSGAASVPAGPAKPAAGAAAGSGVAAAGAPAAAVQRFYTLAAAHDYAGAWALADPAFQSQLGGYASFQAGQSGDRRITFTSLNTTAQHGRTATVALRTTSVRTDGTHLCGGTADLVRAQAATWLLHQIHINCS